MPIAFNGMNLVSETIPYTLPSYELNAFNCPHCNAYAEQKWGKAVVRGVTNHRLEIASCSNCSEFTVVFDKKIVYPIIKFAPRPNDDMPPEIMADFEEAREIVFLSPRGAAALLRLCIQKLCKHLGQPGERIYEDIASLVKMGLPKKVQQSLDIVRVVGNNAVHPGKLDLSDDQETANQLFGLVNLIVEVMITQPKHVDEMYNRVVPPSTMDQIAKRDGL